MALAVLALTVITYRALTIREREQLTLATGVAIDSVQKETAEALALRVQPLERLARNWTVRPQLERGDWEDLASQPTFLSSGYQGILWVEPTLRVRWFAPAFGNSAFAGYDYSRQPAARAAFEAAQAGRTTRASRIHTLPTRDKGFLVVTPVYRGRELEGFVAGAFRASELMHEILLRGAPRGYSSAILEDGQIVHSHPNMQALPRAAALGLGATLDAYGVPWALRVWPDAQSLLEYTSGLPRLVLGGGLLIAVLTALSVRLAATSRTRSQAVERANRHLAEEIADRQRAVEALRHANQTLRAVIDASPAAIVRTTPEGVVTGWNTAAAKLLQWRLDEVLGMSLASTGGAELDNWRVRARVGQEISGVECTLIRKDGKPVPAELWIAHQAGSDSRIAGLICLLADTGPRRQLEKQLRDSTKLEAVARLAGGIAHNFNNLLAIITGYSQLILESTPEGDPIRGEIEQVLGAADRAARLTVQLLAFGRGQAVRPAIVDLNAQIAELQELFERIAGDERQILIPLCAGIGKVRIDPEQVQQMLMTLVLNAREATPPGGRIVIETANGEVRGAERPEHLDVPSGLYVVVSVTDNGPGMDEETRRHLFEPFFTTKGLGPSGLGLSSVYGIAKQNGGGVAVISSPGQGTRIEIYLPQV